MTNGRVRIADEGTKSGPTCITQARTASIDAGFGKGCLADAGIYGTGCRTKGGNRFGFTRFKRDRDAVLDDGASGARRSG